MKWECQENELGFLLSSHKDSFSLTRWGQNPPRPVYHQKLLGRQELDVPYITTPCWSKSRKELAADVPGQLATDAEAKAHRMQTLFLYIREDKRPDPGSLVQGTCAWDAAGAYYGLSYDSRRRGRQWSIVTALVAWERAGVCIGALGVALGRLCGDLAPGCQEKSCSLLPEWKQWINCLLTNTAVLCPWQIMSLSLCAMAQQLLVHSPLLSVKLGARKESGTA